MLTIEYLRQLLSAEHDGLGWVTDPDKQVIDSPDIMEGLTELAQRKGLPVAVLFEDAYHFDDDDRNDVPVSRFTQSVYVMRMCAGTDPKRPEEAQCMADIRRIRNLLLLHQHLGDTEVAGWTRRCRRDFVQGASNYVGWKLSLDFVDDDNWAALRNEE